MRAMKEKHFATNALFRTLGFWILSSHFLVVTCILYSGNNLQSKVLSLKSDMRLYKLLKNKEFPAKLTNMEETISKKYIYRGKVINLRIDKVKLPSCNLHEREIVEHQGSVAILPVDKDGDIFLIKQFRKAVEEEIWEIPAGRIEKGEGIVECAKRELKEETGLSSNLMKKICEYYPSPGYSSEVIHIFLAEELSEGKPSPEIDEFIKIKKFNKEDIIKLLRGGKIKDGKTQASLLFFFLEK